MARYRALGHPIEYHHRTNRVGFKAGALQEGHRRRPAASSWRCSTPTSFRRRISWSRTIHHFCRPEAWAWCKRAGAYLNRNYNLLTEVQAMLLDGHFVLEHGARYGRGLFFNFNGTAGILRRAK